jgi:hypothetical protein
MVWFRQSAQYPSGISGDNRMRRLVFERHATSADQGAFARATAQ